MSTSAPIDQVPEPVGPDPTRPSLPRIQDAFLRGKDNYAVDRAVCRAIAGIAPRWPAAMWAARRFHERVVSYLSEIVGITTFFDFGAGFPVPPPGRNTHQIVNPRYVVANARSGPMVVYVDEDPVCLAHGRVYCEDSNSIYLPGSIRCSAAVFDNSRVRARIDPDGPWGVLVCDLLHYIGDHEKPGQIMRSLIESLPAGSYVVLTHFWNPDGKGPADLLATEIQRRYLDRLGSGWFRPRAEITAYLDGLHVLAPGFVAPEQWWPPGPTSAPASAEEQLLLAAVARKPVGGGCPHAALPAAPIGLSRRAGRPASPA